MANISGEWSFNEDFGFGTDTGIATITQEGVKLKGLIQYTEKIEDEESFEVEQYFEGELIGDDFTIEGIFVKTSKDIEYNIDTWEGKLTSPDMIIGHSYDNCGCFGVFRLKRN
ncbi:MAG: hypothetical protein N4A49_04290 [Marinifilaceae bacterium]|jgi:hypothetical protein|nr:hypothetical protein [Marinifilaceae bacterium]